MSIIGNAGRAAVLYQDSLNQARNAQNSLFAQYGWTMPNSGGGYDTESTGSAFDPNKLYNKETGVLDQAAFDAAAGQMRIGGKGILSDVMRGGGSAEADAMAQSAATGTGLGGLANQRRMLAESQTAGQLGAAKSDYLSQFAQANQPIGGAYQGLQTAINEDKIAAAEAQALKDSAAVTPPVASVDPAVTPPVDPALAPPVTTTPPDRPPANAKQYQRWTNAAGVKYQYINGKWKVV
jgi:hypothetical protein